VPSVILLIPHVDNLYKIRFNECCLQNILCLVPNMVDVIWVLIFLNISFCIHLSDHSVQNHLSSHLLLKNIKIRLYSTIIFPVVLYRCETWSLTLREKYRLRVKNGVFWDVMPCGSCKNRRFGGT
jgi:hypothetical protein